MKRTPGLIATLGVVAIAVMTVAATFNPGTGTGFVGKGDVQLIYNWNNKNLQDNASSVQFRALSVSETTWECTNSNNVNIQQERSRSTTTEGVLDSIARERNQITGFHLTGYDGAPTVETDGPAVNSCPSGPWTLTSPAGDPVQLGSGLQVSINGADWFDLN